MKPVSNLRRDDALKILSGFEKQMKYDKARDEFTIKDVLPGDLTTILTSALDSVMDRQVFYLPGDHAMCFRASDGGREIAEQLAADGLNFPGRADLPGLYRG